ncbi:GNAT family N-acetyltransferase [Nocardioides sp. NPDC059952]|uniref:GNAT family N-acetyltransferase n=1 Tax=Nocardioides sp. NPDC059952 TaxID=3347014 RepID=UPI003646C155
MEIRPMDPEDVPLAQQLSDDAFYEAAVQSRRASDPPAQRRSEARVASWIARTTKFLATDAEGCFVAYDSEGLAGFAASIRRDDVLWILSTFAVRPGLQGLGLGKRLLDAAMTYGSGCPRWMLSASDDPKALRRYRLAGFDLHPQLMLHGTIDRSLLVAVDGVREGTASDLDLVDDIDRKVRGAGHGRDHAALSAAGTLVVDTAGRGYAYTELSGPILLAALDESTAIRLMWECLARTTGPATVGHVTGANQWAVDVGLAARLAIGAEGLLGVRGMAPPSLYLHHGALL